MALQEQAAGTVSALLGEAPGSVEVRMLASDTMLVRFSGEHDGSMRSRLVDAFVAVRNQANVIVDLTNCSFVDSTIITTMLEARDAITNSHGRLAVALPAESNAVNRMAKLVRLPDLIPTYTSVDDALASFR
jgi:anti-anti-sigma factor